MTIFEVIRFVKKLSALWLGYPFSRSQMDQRVSLGSVSCYSISVDRDRYPILITIAVEIHQIPKTPCLKIFLVQHRMSLQYRLDLIDI